MMAVAAVRPSEMPKAEKIDASAIYPSCQKNSQQFQAILTVPEKGS